MPNVRHTPKRRRDDCPECGRNISFTTFQIDFMSPTYTKTFKAHNQPDGTPCPVKPIRIRTRR